MIGIKVPIDKNQLEVVCLEDLVPKDHLVRSLDRYINLNFIYNLVQPLYSDKGRESIDPVVLFKINIIQYVMGIRSMRPTIKEIETNNAYRWYIGYGLNEDIPHFSTYSKNYERRFAGTDIFEQIFKKIIRKISSYGLLDESTVFIDRTHIKANANNHNYINVEVEKSTRYYESALQKEIAEDRKRHGKKDPKTKSYEEVELKYIKQSTVDPDCGVFHKGEHKKVFAYNANVACDKHNFILNFDLGPGNTHDSVMFPNLYHKLNSQFKNIKYLVMDAGYKTPAIIKEVIDNDQIPITPYKRPMKKKITLRNTCLYMTNLMMK